MILFNELVVEGFGSIIKETHFKLNSKGLTVLRGKIGSGKTSIPSSLCWCLFGVSLKKGSTIETWPELRDKDFKGTKSGVTFTKGNDRYEIIRTHKYKGKINGKTGGTSLLIFENGFQISTKKKVDNQRKVEKILGYSLDLFINSIIFGQRLKRIIEESGPNKKKIFDEAFETSFIEYGKVRASKKEKELSDIIFQDFTTLESLKNELSIHSHSLKSFNDMAKAFNKNRINDLEVLNKRIKTLKEDISKVDKEYDSIGVTDTSELVNLKESKIVKLSKLKNELRELKADERLISDINTQLKLREKELNTIKFKKCFTCNSILNKKAVEELRENINNEISKLTKRKGNKAKGLDLRIEDVNKRIEKINKSIDSIESKIDEQKSKQNRIKTLESIKKLLTDDLTKVKKELKNKEKQKIDKSDKKHILKKISEVNKKIHSKELSLNKTKKERDMYKWAISDPLSNSGIKAYIFNVLLEKVNNKLKSYTNTLGFKVRFGIDLSTSNKDFYQEIQKGDISILYPDLSGGQKQLVDTVVALSIHDVISSIRPVNLLFLDEVFEGLDNETIDLVAEIIMNIADKKTTFLITHNQSFNPSNANIIYFDLVKDKTVIS
jgi:DNA repair exonuclease SbcCD ATPase subunit